MRNRLERLDAVSTENNTFDMDAHATAPERSADDGAGTPIAQVLLAATIAVVVMALSGLFILQSNDRQYESVDPPLATGNVVNIVLDAQPEASNIRYQEELGFRQGPGIPEPLSASQLARLQDWVQFNVGGDLCHAQIVDFELAEADCSRGLGLQRQLPTSVDSWLLIAMLTIGAGFVLILVLGTGSGNNGTGSSGSGQRPWWGRPSRPPTIRVGFRLGREIPARIAVGRDR